MGASNRNSFIFFLLSFLILVASNVGLAIFMMVILHEKVAHTYLWPFLDICIKEIQCDKHRLVTAVFLFQAIVFVPAAILVGYIVK